MPVFCSMTAYELSASASAHGRSVTMALGCPYADDSAAMMKADAAWLAAIAPFVPQTGPPSLRINDLRGATEQVLLARSGLRRTCSDYRAGKLNQPDADNILSGFEQPISDYV